MKKPQAPLFYDPNAPVGMDPETRGWRLLVHLALSIALWIVIGAFISR